MSTPSPLRLAAAALLSAGLAGLPHAASAQAFKCKQPDGSTVFQQNPCPGSLKVAAPSPDAAARLSSHDDAHYDPYSPEHSRQRDAALAALPRPAAAPGGFAGVARARSDGPTATSPENDRVRAENARTRAENAVTRAENDRVRAENARTEAAWNKAVTCASARRAEREPPAEYNERRAKELQRANAECR